MSANIVVLKDAKIAVRGVDLSGVSNQVSLTAGVATENSNAFGDDTEIVAPTLPSISGNISGFFEGDTEDAEFFANIGLSGVFVALAQAAALGSRAYFFKATFTSKENAASHGELVKFSSDFSGAGSLLAGPLMENGIFTATGPGTGRQLSTLSASQTLFAQVHALAVSGASPSLSAKIESDVTGFGTPTDRITFDAITAVGAQQKSLVGPITPDDFFRFNVTAISASGSFTLLVVLAIK